MDDEQLQSQSFDRSILDELTFIRQILGKATDELKESNRLKRLELEHLQVPLAKIKQSDPGR